MKKRLCYYVLSTLMGVIFYSCSSDDEVYSCDPDADEWVKENLKEVRSMSRDNWITINDDVLKRAIYSAFTPEQKRKFWNDKLDKIYSLSWSDEEKEHILELIQHINKNINIFEEDLTETDEIFIYKWVEHAKNELNWSIYLIGAIAMSGDDIINIKGEIRQSNSFTSRLRSGTESTTCECQTNASFCHSFLDEPHSPSALCRNQRKCTEKTTGCGWFMQGPCNGMCEATGW